MHESPGWMTHSNGLWLRPLTRICSPSSVSEIVIVCKQFTIMYSSIGGIETVKQLRHSKLSFSYKSVIRSKDTPQTEQSSFVHIK